jgi:alpha-amylase
MPSISLSFKVHIPYRLQKIDPVRIGSANNYFDAKANKAAADKFADECYLPANNILLSLIKKHEGEFKINFSISGTAIEILQEHRPDVIQSFKQLADTGCVEFFAENYYNSLSWLHSKYEFLRQVEKHHELIYELFGVEPKVFRNTELIYCNQLAKFISTTGYRGIFCEGLDRILNGRTPNQIYAAPCNGDFAVLLRNVRLSDDIAFRFDDETWSEQPLTADKYASWIHNQSDKEGTTNLFFDYETFGIHKKSGTGVFDFLEHLPTAILKNETWSFVTVSEAIDKNYPKDIYDVPRPISWEDKEKENCVCSENMMQNNTLHKIYSLETMVKNSDMPGVLERWCRLQSADHFYYMCRDGRTANDIYRSLNPFTTAEEAYENYKNAVMDFEIKIIQRGLNKIKESSSYAHVSNLYSSIF